MRSRTVLLTSIAMVFAVALAACGGGSNAKTTTVGDSGTTTTTVAGSATGTTPGTTVASGAATTTPNFSGSGSGSLCDFAKDIEASKVLENAFTGKNDPASTKDGFTKALAVMNTAVSKAPSEIKADLQTLVTGFKAFADFFATYGYDSTKLTAAMQKDPTLASKLETLDSDQFTAASDRVDAYFQKVCGISSN
jgi:hypothetical protein